MIYLISHHSKLLLSPQHSHEPPSTPAATVTLTVLGQGDPGLLEDVCDGGPHPTHLRLPHCILHLRT